MCLKIYHLDPAKYFSTLGLACQATLKNRGKIKSINWYSFAVNGWKGIRGRICHAIHDMQKLITNI